MVEILKNKSKVSAGFTLIETMGALFVLSVGLLSVLLVFPFVSQQLRLAENTTQASFLAQGQMETLIGRGYDQLPISQTTAACPGTFSAFNCQTSVSYAGVDQGGNLIISATDTGLKKITITVSSSSTPPFNYQLSSLITNR